MSKIVGHFYFKLTANGNIIGEYSHHGMKTVTIESANWKTKTIGFFGTYDTIWIENGNLMNMTLEIADVKNTQIPIYLLVWNDGTNDIYKGEGFIVDGMLIGSYISV
jgi:hypothetical protein